jgi:hypothetical protein
MAGNRMSGVMSGGAAFTVFVGYVIFSCPNQLGWHRIS